MTRDERELSITYLEGMKEEYIEGEGFERHPLPEYYAIENAIKALEQEPILGKIRAEIQALEYLNIEDGSDGYDKYIEQYEVLKIIDKYKAESEE